MQVQKTFHVQLLALLFAACRKDEDHFLPVFWPGKCYSSEGYRFARRGAESSAWWFIPKRFTSNFHITQHKILAEIAWTLFMKMLVWLYGLATNRIKAVFGYPPFVIWPSPLPICTLGASLI